MSWKPTIGGMYNETPSYWSLDGSGNLVASDGNTICGTFCGDGSHLTGIDGGGDSYWGLAGSGALTPSGLQRVVIDPGASGCDDGSSALQVYGQLVASNFVGDGSQLSSVCAMYSTDFEGWYNGGNAVLWSLQTNGITIGGGGALNFSCGLQCAFICGSGQCLYFSDPTGSHFLCDFTGTTYNCYCCYCYDCSCCYCYDCSCIYNCYDCSCIYNCYDCSCYYCCACAAGYTGSIQINCYGDISYDGNLYACYGCLNAAGYSVCGQCGGNGSFPDQWGSYHCFCNGLFLW